VNQLSKEFLKLLGDRHLVGLGKTGSGKSGLHRLVGRAIAANPDEGMTFVDKHGEAGRDTAAWIANPAHRIDRSVHVLTPGSDYSFSLNPFQTERDHPDDWHDAARQWASITSSSVHAQPGQFPRLERIQHVLGFVAAEKKLTLLDLPALLSLGGTYLRDRILAGCSNPIVVAEWEDLHQLAQKKPGQFLEMVESSKNRLVQWLTSRPLMRIFGRHQGLDARKVMDQRQIVLVDLSPLSDVDASFVGKCLTSTYLTAAKRRVPHGSACHRLVIDEAESMLCLETARLLDQTRKYNLLLCCNLQRLAQLRERDDGETIFDAVMSNCAAKVVFAMPEPESARYCAELLFTGFVDLVEWKLGSERPTAVGNDKVIVKSRSRAEHQAESTSSAETDIRSSARASAAMSASMFSAASAFGSGESMSLASVPPDTLLGPPAFVSKSAGHNSSSNSSSARGLSSGRSFSRQYARGRARTSARASTEGTSRAEGESEAYLTRYEDLPTQLYSLEEQLHRLTGEIMSLPRRECFVKLDEQKPFRARTADLEPAFRSREFQTLMLPLYLENAARKSPYLSPTTQIDAEIAARFNSPPVDIPEPDFGPEPMPLLDDPVSYAQRYVERQKKGPPGRAPSGQLDNRHDRFRVVDGKDKGDNANE